MNAINGESQRAILVLGMHRSGTSPTTRVLNLLGASLGTRLMPPVPNNNERGFWENLDAFDIDERLLGEIGRWWHDVREVPDDWLESAAASRAQAAIVPFIQAEFAASPLWAVKDPRICRLAPVWLRALAECGVRPGILFVVRHPLEVAASLQARDGLSRARSLLLWTQHILEAERATRECSRVMVTYDQILEDWSGSMARVSRALGITWPRSFDEARAEIEAFLDAGERHHKAPGAETSAAADPCNVPALVAELFERCVRLSHDEGAWGDLQRSAEEFQRASALYDACISDFLGVAHAAEQRAQRAEATIANALPETVALERQGAQLSHALEALVSQGANLEVVKQRLDQQADMVRRLNESVEVLLASQGANLEVVKQRLDQQADVVRRLNESVEALSASAGSLAATLAAELQGLRSDLAAESKAARSELTAASLSSAREQENIARSLAAQTDAIAALGRGVEELRRGQTLETLRRWLRRSPG